MPDLLAAIPHTRIVPPGHYGAAGTGVTVTLVDGLALASLATRGDGTALAARCRAAFGVELPGPCHVAGPEIGFVGLGPGRWLALGGGVADLEDRLRAALAPGVAVTDQSDAYVLFDVAGDQARAALAKGVALDLDPAAFGPGDAATTSAALIGVTFWQLDAAPTYRFAVGRSFAPGFSRFLVASAAEFGCTVAARQRPGP